MTTYAGCTLDGLLFSNEKGKICKQEIFVNHGKEEGFFFQRTDLSRKRVIGIQIFLRWRRYCRLSSKGHVFPTYLHALTKNLRNVTVDKCFVTELF